MSPYFFVLVFPFACKLLYIFSNYISYPPPLYFPIFIVKGIGLGVYAGACVQDQLRDRYPNPRANRYVLEQSTDDVRPGVFFYTSPEEIEQSAAENGFRTVGNYGLDFFFMASAIDDMDEEKYRCYLELANKMSYSPSCTGLANHALLLCRKKEKK